LENIYLKRYAWPGPQIAIPPKKDTKIIVVIPCYNEPGILDALVSIENCIRPTCEVEIIVVVNHGADEDNAIKKVNIDSALKIDTWINSSHKYQYHAIRAFDLPPKKAGVGMARKIGMDESVRRFDSINEKDGVIVCFDADCLCSANYLAEIERIYSENNETNAALVYFEHDIEALHEKTDNQEAIINYELHLRYYVQALKFAKFPFAYHTVGSCITVTSSAYQKQGGMNVRKAGEDFYFLQRIFPLGNIRNITTTKITPSARPSDRVPFGTGKAVGDFLKNSLKEYATYNPKIFRDFRRFNEYLPKIWQLKMPGDFIELMPESFSGYLENIDFKTQVSKIKKNCKSSNAFIQSMYSWFNGFRTLKYVHHARDNFYPDVEVLDAASWILDNHGYQAKNKTEALRMLRMMDSSEQ
jgi:glycosyltransferase involved in cell wall biosynthesis